MSDEEDKNIDCSLSFVPWKERTYEVCLEHVKKDGWNLTEVPDEYITYEMCLTAIENGASLEDVPEVFRTYELCWKAIDTYYNIFQYIPHEHRTRELCMHAFMTQPSVIDDMPLGFVNLKMCMYAIKKGTRLFHVPPIYRTYGVCLEAVKRDHFDFSWVPLELHTQEMIETMEKAKKEFDRSVEEYRREREAMEQSSTA